MTVAMQRAGSADAYQDFFGFGRMEQIGADLFDAIQENTRVTGNFAKTPRPFPTYPGRPQKKKKATVKDLFNNFQKAGVALHE